MSPVRTLAAVALAVALVVAGSLKVGAADPPPKSKLGVNGAWYEVKDGKGGIEATGRVTLDAPPGPGYTFTVEMVLDWESEDHSQQIGMSTYKTFSWDAPGTTLWDLWDGPVWESGWWRVTIRLYICDDLIEWQWDDIYVCIEP